MEFNTQICTTMEQSKRLLELGLDPQTADMHFQKVDGFFDIEINFNHRAFELEPDYYHPAWSLHRLITMLPFKTNLNSDTPRRLRILPSTDNNFIVVYKEYKVMEKLSLYDSIISIIEKTIKDEYFNKEYLKGE